LQYDTVKGPLSGEVGSVWKLRLHHHGSEDGLPNWNARKPLSSARGEWIDSVRAALHRDAQSNITTYAVDAYGFGKEAARLARLALIADELEEVAIAKSVRAKLMTAMEPWLAGTNTDSLMYDRVWGGLVPKHGLADRGADFGAGYYNDHHFHYGYHIYAFAVVAKAEPEWAAKWKQSILVMVRDIANPDILVQGHSRVSDNLDAALGAAMPYQGPRDEFFPSLRHMDVFDGHSWANGMFASPNGRNQESSTEAVNAYYAIALLGRALGDESLMYLGEVLTSIEISGTHHYWHMTSEKSAYDAPFSDGKCVGMVWSVRTQTPSHAHSLAVFEFHALIDRSLFVIHVRLGVTRSFSRPGSPLVCRTYMVLTFCRSHPSVKLY
jgi:endo-1,3(4)-beta-glucanase